MVKMKYVVFVFVVFLCNNFAENAKILAIFPSPGYSQFFVGQPLLVHLAEKGHEITLMSFHKPKQPVKNIHVVEIGGLQATIEEDAVEVYDYNVLANVRNDYDTTNRMNNILSDANVKKLIQSNATFDLVLLEQVANEPLMAFSAHFKAPLIVFSTIGACEWVNHLVANPAPFSYIPYVMSKFSTSMNILERAYNFLIQTYYLYVKYYILVPKYNEIVKKHFPGIPPIEEIMHNVSLVLLNSHPSATPPYPTTANMIEIGGFHIRPEKLPNNLKDFLDDSTKGAIYFSMGTNVDFGQLGEEKVNAVLEVFSELKENVLWKYREPELPGKPANVLIQKWMPQRAILGHQNVKAFISHCGLISIIESMYFGVPLVCIPVYIDQRMNAALAEINGVAVTVHPEDLNKDSLRDSLNKILNDKSYSENAMQRSKYFRDAPIDPMDLATFWIEFVIRHKGAPHLQNPGLKLHWYQYCFLDVLGLAVGILLIIYALVRFVCTTKYLRRTNNKEKLH